MTVNFSYDSKEFILQLKEHITHDNPSRAKQYTSKLVTRIKNILQYPYIGKINATFDDETIREIVLDGMKIIYPKSVVVLMVYRYIDFDEKNIDLGK